MTREEQRLEFLERHSLSDYWLDALVPDASARTYFRIRGAERPMMLMDAPPTTEHPDRFVITTEIFRDLGARVPEIFVADLEQGFLLIEDLGNLTFTRILEQGADETSLYQSATDEITDIQRAFISAPAPVNLPVYDLQLALQEARLFVEWYLPAITGRKPDAILTDSFEHCLTQLFDLLPIGDMVVVHRDFHVDNLMMIDRRCAFLDYQDAVMGSPAYDMASLLEDARRDVDPGIKTRMQHRWQNRHGFSHLDIEFPLRFWAAQRHCKVAGIFVRLWLRDHKPVYLQHLDRVINLLRESVNHPEMAALSTWLETAMGPVTHPGFTHGESALRKIVLPAQ